MNRFFQVFGLGQCSLDCIGKVDAYLPPDVKCECSETVIQGGGPVVTALVSLSRWGVPCCFTGVEKVEKVEKGSDLFFYARRPHTLDSPAVGIRAQSHRRGVGRHPGRNGVLRFADVLTKAFTYCVRGNDNGPETD